VHATSTSFGANVFSIDEIARAARVSPATVRFAIGRGGIVAIGGFVVADDAVRLVRALRRTRVPDVSPALRAAGARPMAVTPGRRGLSLICSGTLHALLLLALIAASALGLLTARATEQRVDPKPVHLVYVISPGPGGGGGGGGLETPTPPRPAERKATVRKTESRPVPPPPIRRPTPRPPTVSPAVVPPAPQPVIVPVVVPPARAALPAPPAPIVQAPVMSAPADRTDTPGTPAESRELTPSVGPGTGGGIGTGSGSGTGEGQGPGLGDGTGGGSGGGPFKPGSGIDPPSLLREVRPSYTDDARRRAIEGDVVLEVVVQRDGSVGNVRVLQTLGAGLEQKAIEAVRQWRFAPAKRLGTSVDVVVEVSVEFKLREALWN
jgi:TonB family protein